MIKQNETIGLISVAEGDPVLNKKLVAICTYSNDDRFTEGKRYKVLSTETDKWFGDLRIDIVCDDDRVEAIHQERRDAGETYYYPLNGYLWQFQVESESA